MSKRQDIQCILTDQNNHSIYISNLPAAQNISTLKSLDLRAVITVARGAFLNHTDDQLPNYLYLPVDDQREQDIAQFFSKTNRFIQKNIKKSNVLIHCVYGVSRSATIIIAYLMFGYSYTFNEAFLILKQKRPKIKPNTGFVTQLQQYQLNLTQQDQHTLKKQYQYNQILETKKIVKIKPEQQKVVFLSQEKDKKTNQNINKQMVIALSKQNDEIMNKINKLKQKMQFHKYNGNSDIQTIKLFLKHKQHKFHLLQKPLTFQKQEKLQIQNMQNPEIIVENI